MVNEPILHSLSVSQVMLNYAATHGIDAETCLAGTGIAPEQFQDAEALIAREQELRLIENLMLALPDVPALGFELGMQYNVSTFGTWGFALRTSRTLREAVDRAIRYLPLSTAYCAFSTVVREDELHICADPSPIPPQLRRLLLERDLGTCVNLILELNFAGRSIRRIELAGPAPSYNDRIAELCRVPVQFNHRHNCIIVSLGDFMKPLPSYDERLVRLLEDQCRQLLERRQVGGIAGRVRQQLLQAAGLVATLEDVAAAFNMSARSLRRKLESEDTSFRLLVEEVRHQLALQLLDATEMKLDEMATHLGYADTASFTRAFRRWQGLSPGQYRARDRA
jgi:AraC-like DNA-binding protein